MNPAPLSAFGDTPDIHAFVQGASRGIGLSLARQLLQNPQVSRLFATSRAPHDSPGLAELAKAHPGRLTLLAIDLERPDTIAQAAQAVDVPRLHMVLNVSGLLHDVAAGMAPEKSMRQLDPAALGRSFAVNAIGPALVIKHLARRLRHTDRAVIANLSARVGSIGDNRLGGWYGYRASKAALNQLTRTMAIELGRRPRPNVLCVALHPGTVDTQLSEPFQAGVPEDKLFSAQRAAAQLLGVLDGLTPQDTGRFFDWAGLPIPW